MLNNQRTTFQFGVGFLFLLLMVTGLFYLFITDRYQQTKIAQHELSGVSTIVALHNVILDLQRLRGLSQIQLLSDHHNVSQALLKNKERFLIHHNELRLVKEQHPELFGDIGFAQMLEHLESLLPKEDLDHHTHFIRYSHLIKRFLTQIFEVGDTSQLFIDPERESFLIMNLFVLHMPPLIESIAQTRGMLTRITQLKGITPKEKEALRQLELTTKHHIEEIQRIVFKLGDSNHRSLLTTLINRLSHQVTLMHQFTLNPELYYEKQHSVQFFNEASLLVEGANRLFLELSNILTILLEERISKINHTMLLGGLFSLVIVIASLMIFIMTTRRFNNFFKREHIRLEEIENSEALKTHLMEANDLRTLCEHSLHFFAKHFDALQGTIYLYQRDNHKLSLGATYACNASHLKQTLDVGETLIGEALTLKEPVQTIIDKSQIHAVESGLFTLQPHHLSTIPLQHLGDVVAVMQLSFGHHKGISSHQKEFGSFSDTVASYISEAIHNEKVENHLRIIDHDVITSSTNERGIITGVSEAFAKISGYSKDELIGQPHSIVRHPDTPEQTFRELWDTITMGKTWHGEIKNRTKQGGFYWVDVTIRPDMDLYGNILGYTAVRHDITDKKRIEELSITDGLTGLYNRRHFDQVFKEHLATANRNDLNLVFVLMDIDHFKQYNDTYGHQEGDNTLKAVARVLKASTKRPDDFVFRLGGEEFGLLFYGNNKENILSFVDRIRENVEALGISHVGNSASSFVTISMGVHIISPERSKDPKTAYIAADEALYRAKEEGRNRIIHT